MDLFPTNAPHGVYFYANMAASLLGLSIFVFFYSYRRYLFVKPSVMVLGCYHVLAQWPSVLLSPFIETFLPAPWIFAGLVHGFVLIGLLISFISFDQSAKSIWDRLPAASAPDDLPPRWQLLSLFCTILILASIYLAYVPIEQTGLYAIFTDPERAVSARELSLKLLDNWIPRYALTLLGNVFAPLLTAMAINLVLLNRRCSIWEKSLWIALLVLCWMLAALSGAKAIWSYLIVASLAVVAWRIRLRIPATFVVAGVAAILAPAFIIFMLFSLTIGDSNCSSPSTKIAGESRGIASQKEPEIASRGNSKVIASQENPKVSSNQTENLCAIRLDATKSHSAMTPNQNAAISIMAALGLSPHDQSREPTTQVTVNKETIKHDESLSINTILKEKSVAPEREGSNENTCDPTAATSNRPGLALDALSQFIATSERAFIGPAVVSVWFADYAQRNGPIGLAGIPRLAQITGIAPINLASQVALIYAPCYYGHKVIESMTATTGFLFAEYGCFGLLALPLALVGLLVCDGLLLIIRTFPVGWLAPTLAFVSLAALKFTQTDYLTMWVTHGLGIVILIAGLANAGTVVQRKWRPEAL